MRPISLVLAALCLVPRLAVAADNGRPVTPSTARSVAATPIPSATAIRLDGELNEEVWKTAPAIDGFLQREPKDGAPATYPTVARVAYDAEAIYVAVWASDPEPDRIVGFLTRRDTDSPSEWIRIAIDSYHDHRTAYQFGVNPSGVKQDVYMFNDGSEDSSWDAVWEVEVRRDERGWRAEFRIPFSQLRFNAKNGGSFGFAVVREVARLKETSSWPLLSKKESGIVSSFGELTGLDLNRSPKRLELVPYVVGQVTTQPTQVGNPFVKATGSGRALGADLKYTLTPGLTLTATANPDFGQVEADPAVVNLTAFETLYQERRPFFVEGSGTFRFDLDCSDGNCTGLFYSRRIGRSPHGTADTPDGGFSKAPDQTTILGATKVTGRVGGFSIGVLNAFTSDEKAQVASGGVRSSQAIEPFTSYSVGRARREFSNQSSLGFMFTAANRRLTDSTRFLAGAAYTGGVDWDWRLRQSTYSLAGFLAGSTLRGNADAIGRLQQNSVHGFQRPDASHVEYDPTRTSLSGNSGSLSVSKNRRRAGAIHLGSGMEDPGFRRQRRRVHAASRRDQRQ